MKTRSRRGRGRGKSKSRGKSRGKKQLKGGGGGGGSRKNYSKVTTETVNGIPVSKNFVMTTNSGMVMSRNAHKEYREQLQKGDLQNKYD